jgi:hypothetical protein
MDDERSGAADADRSLTLKRGLAATPGRGDLVVTDDAQPAAA